MKRKVYTTQRERMIDRILGLFAFPLLNIPLGIMIWMIPQRIDSPLLAILILALPWVVNGIVLVLAFLLRPEFAIGYIVFIGAAVALATGVGVVFLAACFVIIPLVPVLGDLTGWAFACLMAVGLVVLGIVAYEIIRSW
jgi:hypothetical protein